MAKGLKPLAGTRATPGSTWPAAADRISARTAATRSYSSLGRFSVPDTHRVVLGGAWQEIWVGGVSEGGNGVVLVSRDGGATWAQSTPAGLEMGWYGDLRLDRTLLGSSLRRDLLRLLRNAE